MGEPALRVRAAGPGITRADVLRRCDHLVECAAHCTDVRREDFGQRAAFGAEHGRSREQRLDRGQPEGLVPLRRHPETPRAREQHRLALAPHLADVLDVAGEARPPAAGDDQPAAGAFRRFDRPVVAAIAVQLAEKEIPLLLARPEDEVRGIEPVVHEGVAAVAPGMIARQKNRMRGQSRSGLPVAMQCLHEGDGFRALLQGKMSVQNVGIVGQKRCEIGASAVALQGSRGDFDDAGGGGEFGARLGENGHAMPQGRQRLDQRHDDALRSAIAFDRKPVMGCDHDVHRSPSITSFALWRRAIAQRGTVSLTFEHAPSGDRGDSAPTHSRWLGLSY